MLEVGGGGRVRMALGGGMQDKNEAGGGMLYPCVPPVDLVKLDPQGPLITRFHYKKQLHEA